MRPPFHYVGTIPASKSMMNRALIAQSFSPQLRIHGHSDCDDVRLMMHAMVSLLRKQEIDCGEAGTVFRFMAMRASREPGPIRLKASRRLMQRPQQELMLILAELGVQVDLLEDGLILQGSGWKRPLKNISIPRERSSQFGSGVLLSAWNLPFELTLEFSGQGVSEGYWKMTVDLVRRLGMSVDIDGHRVHIPPNQKIENHVIDIEPDYSSMFAVCAAALVNGDVTIKGVSEKSVQPDHIFLSFLKEMGVPIHLNNGELHLTRAGTLQPLEVSLRSCPDLGPVLACLCAFATGTSKLMDAPQLVHKESNRLANTLALLEMAGVRAHAKNDGLWIDGTGPGFKPNEFYFDPDQDHRMAMAAALFRLREDRVGIHHIDVVKKSFPEFWKVIGIL